ncbi:MULTISPECIES: LIC10906 family membrane protein [Leptospira]|uniref:LIC10906 family membrane protein n=1 Tax=Leptospira TaxID=171 RepID=UPI0002986BD7|nr:MULTISPECIES: histidine kinase N-terminal 7TM domain-containing protein [Leptospira]EKR82470.1 putative membrane protein [Leptospira interrogans str. UI 08452]EMN33846.1 putative membrane protein [Leptospira interrogans serovar Medanensis str. L0448]EMN38601.1 putative membrane protein [Leptospira interrogans str. L0996]EMN96961.1 putative membrane protein [Leptospira interrogans serovar Medanensis str. UT053]
MSLNSSSEIILLNSVAALFIFLLGFYVLYPSSKRKIQKYFGILCLLLGAWFQSFILREIVPSWSYNWLINWGLIPSIPIPYYLFKITSSYNQREQKIEKPRKIFHFLNFLLICLFSLHALSLQTLQVIANPNQAFSFKSGYFYKLLLIYSLCMVILALANLGFNTIREKGRAKTNAVLLFLGLIPPIISVLVFIYIRPTIYGVFSGGYTAIGFLIGTFIWSIAIMNCDAFQLRQFSVYPKERILTKITKPAFNFLYSIVDKKAWMSEVFSKNIQFMKLVLIKDIELKEDYNYSFMKRSSILARMFGNYIK